MNNKIERIGNFTSSRIHALMSEPTAAAKKEGEIFGVPAKTLIKKCNFERMLGRSISEDTNSRPTSYGRLVEKYAFGKLGLDYKLSSQETIVHPTIKCFAGSPDGIHYSEQGNQSVIDIKAPYTLLSFCQLYECKDVDSLRENYKYGRENYKYGEAYYWQLVANSILTECKFAELVTFCPFKSELDGIIHMAAEEAEELQKHYYWIAQASHDDLPYIPDGNPNYDHFHKIRFEINQEDVKRLTERVILASTLLI
jgi:hypothetical protein